MGTIGSAEHQNRKNSDESEHAMHLHGGALHSAHAHEMSLIGEEVRNDAAEHSTHSLVAHQKPEQGHHNQEFTSQSHSEHRELTGQVDKARPADHAGHHERSRPNEQNKHTGHTNHAGHATHSPEMFRRRFWLSLLLTIPVLIYSSHIQMWFGFAPPLFPGSKYVPVALGVIIYFYGGLVFVKNGVQELRSRQPGMMTLIGLAITVAFTNSLLVSLGIPGEELYWEMATLVVIMLLGHWFEMSSVQGARGELTEMAKLLPDTAWLIVDGDAKEVPISSLNIGDLVLVRPGAHIPADGQVVQGESHLNEAMITGESAPVPKQPGDRVIAGTINDEGSLRVRVEKTGSETALAGIMRLVEQAQTSRSRAQVLADRAAFWLVLIAVGMAVVTAVGWGIAEASGTFVLERVVTVLVAACPHALGLAIPLVIAISTTLSARNGLLVKDRLAFERARALDYVVFDKTGTLTKGKHDLVGIYPAAGMDESETLRLAAAVESDSGHMISRGIVSAVREREVEVPEATSFESLAGRGVKALVGGKMVYVGGPNLLRHLGLTQPESLQAATEAAGARGENVTYLVVENEVKGAFAMADIVREESREAVQALKKRGVKVAMLTGDSEAVASAVARKLGIDRYFAGVLPEHKAAKIEELKREGHQVAMVGDGVNDAPALATADVGVAIGAGTDVAVESAGIVLVRNDPRDVVRLIDLSRASYRKMVQNLVWATGYNVIVLPLAAGVLAPLGFVLPMALGAIIMSASTVIVALNAQLLRNIKLNTVI